MSVSANAVKYVQEACEAYDVTFKESDIKEIILGIRNRLREIAVGGSHEEHTNVAVFVLQSLVSEFKFTAVGCRYDSETLGAWTWDCFVAAADGTKAAIKLEHITNSSTLGTTGLLD